MKTVVRVTAVLAAIGLMASASLAATPPEAISVSQGTYTDRVQISWRPGRTGGPFEFQVYRADVRSRGAPLLEIGTWQFGTSVADLLTTAGQHYFYYVRSRTP